MSSTPMIDAGAVAEVVLPSGVLAETLAFFTERLGFRVETIFPADAPRVATLSGHGLRLRLTPDVREPGTLRLLVDEPGPALTAPNGTRIERAPKVQPIDIPPLKAGFVLTRRGEGPPPGAGRAGMIYRDLIPDRQGGRFIASHITIPDGGPVKDWVHFHEIAFQLLYCVNGWAKVVYEDQGEPFLMQAGDLVLQPPRIRHRVLETSSGFDVVEIACPALHETKADHAMTLPTGRVLPDRDFGGQRFLHHKAADGAWVAAGGFERRDTGTAKASNGAVEVCVLRPAGSDRLEGEAHDGELLFGYVLAGSAVLEHRNAHPLADGDAFVVPPAEAWSLSECSTDLQLLQLFVPQTEA